MPTTTLQPHQQRVIDERNELEKKLRALDKFIDPENLNPLFDACSEAEKTRLLCQFMFMSGYLDILNARINAF